MNLSRTVFQYLLSEQYVRFSKRGDIGSLVKKARGVDWGCSFPNSCFIWPLQVPGGVGGTGGGSLCIRVLICSRQWKQAVALFSEQ